MLGLGRGAWPLAPLALLLTAHAGVLRVVEGPAELLGTAHALSEFTFSPSAAAAYDVHAPVVLVEHADWASSADSAACPPTYRGRATLDGAIALSVDADVTRCSPEAYARAAQAAGARAWLLFYTPWLAYAPEPGHARHLWLAGDARALAAPLVAADATQRSAAPLVAALRAGAPVRARLRRTAADPAEPWAVEQAGFGWTATRVWVCAGALLLVEVAAVRLYAFVRAEGVRAASLVQWLLLIELGCNGCRLALFAADPLLTNARLPYHASDVLAGLTIVLGELTSALFLGHFLAAAAKAGLGSTLLSARTAAALVALVATAVGYEIAIRSAPLRQALPSVALTRLVLSLLCSSSLVLVGALAAQRVRGALGALPPAVLRVLQQRVDAAVTLHALTFGFALALPWAALTPRWRAPVVWALYTAALGTSWAIVRTFAPPPPRLAAPPAGEDGDGPPAPLASGLLERAAVWVLARAEGVAWRLVDRLDAARARAQGDARPAAHATAGPAARAARARVGDDGTPAAERSVALAPHLLLGVSPAYMRAFARRHALGARAPTLALGALARELTADSRRSLAEDARARGETTSSESAPAQPAVGPASVFVSHAQQASFLKLVDAVDAHVAMHALDGATTYCWLDGEGARGRARGRYARSGGRASGAPPLVLAVDPRTRVAHHPHAHARIARARVARSRPDPVARRLSLTWTLPAAPRRACPWCQSSASGSTRLKLTVRSRCAPRAREGVGPWRVGRLAA